MQNLNATIGHLITHDYRGPLKLGRAGWFVDEMDERVVQCQAAIDMSGMEWSDLSAAGFLAMAQHARLARDLIGEPEYHLDRTEIFFGALCKLDGVIKRVNRLAARHTDWARWGRIGNGMQMRLSRWGLVEITEARAILRLVVNRLPEPTAHQKLAAARQRLLP